VLLYQLVIFHSRSVRSPKTATVYTRFSDFPM
jgi:hypothetical protein